MKDKAQTDDVSDQVILQWVHDTHWAITLGLFRKHQNREHLLLLIEGEKKHHYIDKFNLNIKEVKKKHQVTKKMTSELWSEVKNLN